MTWTLRDKSKEAPEYNEAGMFSLKIHHGGKMRCYPHRYSGGGITYVDNVEADTMSLFEVQSMLDECGEKGDAVELFFSSPCTEMEYGLWPIESDADVLRMCRLVGVEKVMFVYSIQQRPLSQSALDFFPSPDPDYIFVPNDPARLAFEKKQAEELLMFEGIFPDFSEHEDADVVPNLAADEVVETIRSDDENDSFHGDSSNNDSTDDEAPEVVGVPDAANVPAKTLEDIFDDAESVSDVSEYHGSEDERMAGNSTDEEESQYPVFNENIDMSDPKFQLGLLFGSAPIFRAAVKKYALVNRRNIKRVKIFGSRVKYICHGQGCKWNIYASKMQNSQTYQVKRYTAKHSCNPSFQNSQINSTWIANQYENDIRFNPTWPLAAFQQKVINDWRCDVSIHAIGRAKKKALEKINGKHGEQYGLICVYANELKKSMPGSTVEVVLEDLEAGFVRRRFKRIYICLGPLKIGFVNGCRPIIDLDGCFLKGPFGGQLLAAVGSDSNDGMYPIAWAVVEAENSETWNWFLRLLASDVGIENSHAFTFISDRQKGLINALETVVPNAEHRFCVMHLYKNMVKEHKGIILRKYLWMAARATTDYMFNKQMEELKKLSKKCYEWLMEKPRSQWTRSAFRLGCLSDMFVNNHCEAFNSSIRTYRELPIIKMLQCIHLSVMQRIQQRRDKMLKSYVLNPICPNAMRKIAKSLANSGGCMVKWSGLGDYLVTMTEGGYEIVVNLDRKECACRKYQLTGLPCYHAAACIRWRGLELNAHIHSTYRKDVFLECYKHVVRPINSEQFWSQEGFAEPLPPPLKVAPGRPKKKRNRSSDVPVKATKLRRQNTTLSCSACGVYGHNNRTCKVKITVDASLAGTSSTTAKPKKKKPTTSKASTVPTAEPTSSVVPTLNPNIGDKYKPRKGKKNSEDISVDTSSATAAVLDAQIARLQSTESVGASSQGGVFTSYTERSFVQNTPLGVQPTRFTENSKVHLTTLKELEAAKNARKKVQPPKPHWKL